MKRTSATLLMTVLVLLASATLASAQTKELVVAAWGSSEAAMRKALIPNFEKTYGVKLVWVPGNSSATLAKLRAQKDSPQIDLAMIDDGPHRQAVALGLVDRIDRTKLTNAKDLYEPAYEPEDYGIA